MRFAWALAASALLVAGCGQRGPLYLRESPPPGVKPERPQPYRPVPYPKEAPSERGADESRDSEPTAR